MSDYLKPMARRQARVPRHTINSLIAEHNKSGQILYGPPTDDQVKRVDGSYVQQQRITATQLAPLPGIKEGSFQEEYEPTVLYRDQFGRLSWSPVGEAFTSVTTVTTATYSVVAADNVIHVDDDTVGGAVTIVVPEAAQNANFAFRVKKLGSTGTVSLVPLYSTDTIDGETSIQIYTQWTSLYVLSDGANWFLH